MLITSTAQIALEASAEYGTTAYPSTFAPDCNAYDFLAGAGSDSDGGTTTTYANATSVTAAEAGDGSAGQFRSQASINATFTRGGGSAPPLPRAFFAAAANQPSFADGRRCDAMTRHFDTALSADAAPVAARVRASLDVVFGEALLDDAAVAVGGGGGTREMVWTDVPGWQVDSAFVEEHLVSCEGLQAPAQAQQAQKQAHLSGSGVGGSGSDCAALRPSGASPEVLLTGGTGKGGGRGGCSWFQALEWIWRGSLKRPMQREL